jgi:hypothetical protein
MGLGKIPKPFEQFQVHLDRICSGEKAKKLVHSTVCNWECVWIQKVPELGAPRLPLAATVKGLHERMV